MRFFMSRKTAANGGALPKFYGNWHTVYTRMNRWSKNGVLQRLFEALQQENVILIKMEAVCLDSTSIKVHPNGTGALKKAESRESINQTSYGHRI